MVEIVNTVGLSGAQLHGREPMSEARMIRHRVPFLIQAFAAGDAALSSAGNSPADVILVDSPTPGSGRVFDWTLAEGAPGGVRILLAGGLDTDERRRGDPTGAALGRRRLQRRGDLRRLRPQGAAQAPSTSSRSLARSARRSSPTAGSRHGPLEPDQRPYDWAVDQQR